MDWKKLHENIYAFANSHSMRIEEADTNYLGGQITTYQLEEDSKVFYELKHAKPIKDHGSNLRVYSESTVQLSISIKTRLFGRPTMKSNIELTEKTEQLLTELAKRIGPFKWVTEPHHHGWPNELGNSKVLKFECKRVDLATQHIETIRQIHWSFLKNNSV